MASIKEATGSEPEGENKTESPEDSEEPFKFYYVSVFAV